MFLSSFNYAIWLWLTFGCVIVFISLAGVSGISSSEDEEDDNCRRLPPNAERSHVEGESQMNIVSLLNGGSDTMKARIANGSEFYPEEAILILGNTGCGKTTLTQIIASNLSRIHAVLTHSGDMVIVDDDERIGAPSTVSRTLVPELVPFTSNENSTTYFYDCPGFDDTRGPEQDLAANYFMNQIIRKVKRVKLLFLVKHTSVIQGHDRLGFDLLVKHATEFVHNLGPFERSIGLVVTKVNGYSFETKVLKDKKILSGITNFISNYNQTLHLILQQKQTEQERTAILKKIEFVNILLQKDENNSYKKLAFSRSPDTCGPLSSVASVLKTREMVTQLCRNLEYAPVGTHENFGYTLKENTLLSIQNFAKQINNETTKLVAKTIANFSNWFEQKKLNVSNSVDATIAFMNNSKLAIKMLTKDFKGTLLDLSNILPESLKQVGYVVTHNFKEFLEKQENFLMFFDEATATNIDRQFNDWFNPVLLFGQKFDQWFSSSIHNLGGQVNQQIIRTVEDCLDNFTVWFDQKIVFGKENAQNFVLLLESSKFEIESLNQSMSDSPTEMANLLTSNLAKLGYNVTEQFQIAMEKHNSHLDYFDLNSDSKVDRHVTQWFAPIQAFQEQYKTWWTSQFRALENDININVTKAVQQLMTNTITWLNDTHIQESQNISVAIELIQAVQPVVEQMVPENTTQFTDNLINSVHQLGYNLTGEFETTTRMYMLILDSLQTTLGLIVNVTRNLAGWQAPIKEFQLRYTGWQNSVVKDLTQKVNNDIASIIDSTLDNAWKLFIAKGEQVAAEANPAKMVALIDSSRLVINRESLPREPSELGKILKVLLEKVGYSDQIEGVLEQQGENLKQLDNVQGIPVFRTVDKWHSYILSMQRKQDDWVQNTAQNVARSLNSKIEKTVEDAIMNFSNWFSRTKSLTNKNLRLISLPVIQSTQSIIRNFVGNSYNSADDFALGLKTSLQNIQYNVPYSFVGDLLEYERCFRVLDNAVKVSSERALMKWTRPVLKFQVKLDEFKQTTIESISNLTRLANAGIVTEIGKEFVEVKNWLERGSFSETYSVTEIIFSMQSFLTEIQGLLKSEPESPSDLSHRVKSTLERIGYTVSDHLVKFLIQQENIFKFVDGVKGFPVTREKMKWCNPILGFKNALEVYITWYNFCGQLQDKLFSNSDELRLLRDTAKLQLLPERSSGAKWLQFLEKNGIYFSGYFVKAAESKLGRQHIKRLENIVIWGLGPVRIYCTEPDTLILRGTFIRFTDLVHQNGNLKWRCDDELENVKIFALDTIFVDAGLNAVGKELTVTLIAPKWEVRKYVHLNLDGTKGETPETDYEWGAHGKAGMPGGPGGNFLGVAGSILNAWRLTISVNGGDGGDGGDAYNGKDGINGNDGGTNGRDGEWVNVLVYTDYSRIYQGTRGGDGGDGGKGGQGGYGGVSGDIDIKSQDGTHSSVKLNTQRGKIGGPGVGGKGGKGGIGGRNKKCVKKTVFFITTENDCYYFGQRQQKGMDGNDGIGVSWRTWPEWYKSGKNGLTSLATKMEYESQCANNNNIYSHNLNQFIEHLYD